MFRYLILSCICLVGLPVLAQTFSISSECREAVRSGENVRTPHIYDTCGFNDEMTAFEDWDIWAESEKAGQALYEICIRHPSSEKANTYCQEAIQFGNGPALLYQANKFYSQKEYTYAANYYTKALSSPLLNDAEKGDIAQKMGLLYLNPESSYYNPQKGLPLIERAIERRGAEANNLMGIYALFGQQGVPQNAEESFKYFWRAILLGCPAAEENLGLWHLAKQKKIDNKTARQEMSQRMFSCTAPDYVAPQELEKHHCDCQEVADREQRAAQYPYRPIEISGKKATLLDKDGQKNTVEVGTILSNGMKVTEIRSTAVILTSGNARLPINLAPVDDCPELCQKEQAWLLDFGRGLYGCHCTAPARL